MFTLTKKKTEAKQEAKLVTLCDDCKSFLPVSSMSEWIKCPHCGMHFQATTVYRKAR